MFPSDHRTIVMRFPLARVLRHPWMTTNKNVASAPEQTLSPGHGSLEDQEPGFGDKIQTASKGQEHPTDPDGAF